MSQMTEPLQNIQVTDKSFQDLGLSPEVIHCVTKVGFIHPAPIQAQVIPIALQGRDLIGCAQTGTGKTAAFVLPLVEKLRHERGLRGLILCPTREIAAQTKEFLDLFGHDKHIMTVMVIGGVAFGPQIKGLKAHPDVVVATPGRLVDHMERKNVSLSRIQHLVLDEADHMLDLGFLPQIYRIMKEIPKKRQTMMFSATMPFEIQRLTHQFLHDPLNLGVATEGKVASGITQRLYLITSGDKKKCVIALLQEVPGKTLIFTRTKLDAAWLAKALQKEGFAAQDLHSDLSQTERREAVQGFREGQFRVLVASDIAARGLDIPEISHVINYDIPENPEDYVHRVGRTARYQAKGLASTIASWMDRAKIQAVETKIGHPLERVAVEGVSAYVELSTKKRRRRRGGW